MFHKKHTEVGKIPSLLQRFLDEAFFPAPMGAFFQDFEVLK
jgi:hypothetical protein